MTRKDEKEKTQSLGRPNGKKARQRKAKG